MKFIAVFCLCLLCLSCSDPQPAEIRIGTNVWPGYEPLYVAREQGAFADLPVQLVEYRSASQAMSGLRKGQIDFAAVTLDEAIRIHANDVEVEVIWIFDYSNGADQLLSQPDIKTVAGLKGKRLRRLRITAVFGTQSDTAARHPHHRP